MAFRSRGFLIIYSTANLLDLNLVLAIWVTFDDTNNDFVLFVSLDILAADNDSFDLKLFVTDAYMLLF